MKQNFSIVKSLKPKSSDKKSNEIYLIGLKKKKPNKLLSQR